jgi:hypothetical protein
MPELFIAKNRVDSQLIYEKTEKLNHKSENTELVSDKIRVHDIYI